MKAFVWLKTEIWSMELAYVDEPAKDKNGVQNQVSTSPSRPVW